MSLITNMGEIIENVRLMKQLCNSVNKSFKNYRIDISYKLASSLSRNGRAGGPSRPRSTWTTTRAQPRARGVRGAKSISVYFSCIKGTPNHAIVNYDSEEDEEILYMNTDVINTNLGKIRGEWRRGIYRRSWWARKLDTERRIYYFFDGEDEAIVPRVTVNAVELNIPLITDETPLINRPGYVYSDT